MSTEIRTSPLRLQAGLSPISLVVSVSDLQRTQRGPFAMFAVLAATSGPQLYANDSLMVVAADDSIQLTMMTRHSNMLRPNGTNLESTFGQMPATDLLPLRNASHVAIEFSGKSYALAPSGLQALRALIGEIGKPVSNRTVATGCAGVQEKPPSLVAVATQQMVLQHDTAGGIVLVPVGPAQPYSESQVDKPARVIGNPQPVYPEDLRKLGVEGVVITRFTVLENGTADMDTFKVLESSDGEFSWSVRDVVRRMRFIPAEKAGHAVRQQVQLPFAFKVYR